MNKTIVLQVIYELIQLAKQFYAKHKRNKVEKEIESIEENTVGAWDSQFGSTDSRMPSDDKSAGTANAMPTSKTDDAAS